MASWNQAEGASAGEQQLRIAYGRALEMASFKGGFLMRTAHELRSPLNKIISLQQMILEGLCDDIEEERQFVADAYAASLKMLEYLDLMIRVSKIEMGRLEPQLQPVSLAEVFTQVKDLTQMQVADRNLRLTVELPKLDIKIQTDSAWLCNLLTLLIEMAVDGSDRGNLHLRLAVPGNDDMSIIWLEDDRPTPAWQEAAQCPSLQEFDLNDTLSTSLRMSLAEAMTTAMGGRLSLLSLTTEKVPTRLQIALPNEG
ncbi:MAG: histidine kinase dimerization/phospho-acceptor domain-containing protein [Cyanobacteria bacterium P01_H01_bin.152]